MNNSIFFKETWFNFKSKPIIAFSAIVVIAVIIRMYYYPHGIPVTMDGLVYFKYAVDVSILGHLPETSLTNNGWPTFLSLFFSNINSENFLDYMTVQRIVSISISILTSIPVYFLCRKFFDYKFALVGVALFLLEPRIIQNSLIGITEPLFILFTTTSLTLFFSNNKKMIYLSFAVAAIATLVRYEGVVLFFAISILYFIKFRKDYKKILEYGILLGIFILVLTPMVLGAMEIRGEEKIIASLVSGSEVFTKEAISFDDSVYSTIFYIINGLTETSKFLGWTMVPTVILFVPLGIMFMFKNKIPGKISILIPTVILIIPAFYAYSRGIDELRYLFVLYPLLSLISLFTIKQFFGKIKKHNLFLGLLVVGIIFSSVIFLEWKNIDSIHELEAYEISKKVVDLASATNRYGPESKYIRVGDMHDKSLLEISSRSLYEFNVSASPKNYNTLTELITKNELSHLVVDDSTNRMPFLVDVFEHEDSFPFLIKVYDSRDDGYNYHVKIFRIDYEKFIP